MKQQMDQAPSWAQEIINSVRNTQQPILFLGGHGGSQRLTSVPQEILEMTWLETLYLDGNLLASLPTNFNRLIHLKNLYLHDNILRTVPEVISNLENLQELYLSNNKIVDIPDSFSQLVHLQKLHLHGNQLREIPEAFSKLLSLRVLWLSDNKIKTLPSWLAKLPNLEQLFLANNVIVNPPPEILNLERTRYVNLNALRAYFRQGEEVGKEALYEAKLIIVGEPGAGKTSLTRKLIDPAAPLPKKDESTEGIDIHKWAFPIHARNMSLGNEHATNDRLSKSDKKFNVNIWDFGGQEIYHATHQFFLSRRSLYIVVVDAREQKTDFFHWLDLIEHLSGRSPVIIFNNAFQNRHWAINEQQLKTHFPDTFRKPFSFNLEADSLGLRYLRQKVQEYIVELPHVGDVLPRTWINVRKALESDMRATVSQGEFLQLCKANGFTRRDDALQLSSYLHDLGVILHFQDDPLLKQTVILRPEWGTDAVYRVLDNEEVKANLGFFSRAKLGDIWYEDEYALWHDELLALMMKFQLCYAIPEQTGQYIAPQLLSEQPPDYDLITPRTENTNSLYLRFKYEAFMPKGLLTRFIVTMHPHIAIDSEHQIVWRSGVVLEKDGTRAEVVEFYHLREIRIRVMGKNMRDLLTIINYQLDELHRPFHRLKYDKLIPCNCTACRAAEEPYFYRLDVLKTRLEHGKAVIECDVPPFETVQIRPLLDDVGAAVQPAELPTLLRTLNRDFNDDEFKTLCLDLSVNYDNLSGEGLEGKQREFLLKLERNGRLPELINLLRQKRPHFNW